MTLGDEAWLAALKNPSGIFSSFLTFGDKTFHSYNTLLLKISKPGTNHNKYMLRGDFTLACKYLHREKIYGSRQFFLKLVKT